MSFDTSTTLKIPFSHKPRLLGSVFCFVLHYQILHYSIHCAFKDLFMHLHSLQTQPLSVSLTPLVPRLVAILQRSSLSHTLRCSRRCEIRLGLLLLKSNSDSAICRRRRPNLEELKMLLVTLCNERERTYVVVDALDECDAIHERRLFLPLLQSLPYGSTRLFVTSRPNHEDIYHVFDMASQITIAAPGPEIKRFVTEKMEERKDFMERVTPDLKNLIISTICTQASGM